MNVSRFLALCAIFVCFTVSASVTVPAKVVHIANFVSSDSAGITLSGVVKGFASNDPFAARTVTLSKSRFMAFVKPNIGTLVKGNLWWLAFATAIESMGWAIDELKGQVVQPVSGWAAGYFWAYPGYANYAWAVASTKIEACEKYGSQMGTKGTLSIVNDACVWMLNGKQQNAIWPQRYSCPAYAGYSWVAALSSCSGGSAPSTPVDDDALYSAIQSQLAANPSAAPFTDPATLKPYEGLFDDQEYAPGLSEADEALVKCYVAGNLQMTNSAASCYVPSQAEYDRIKAAAEAIQAGKTADQIADELNADLDAAAIDATDVTSITDAYGKSEIQDSYDDLLKRADGSGDITTPSDIPVLGDLSLPGYQSCRSITVEWGGNSIIFPNQDQCASIEAVKQGIGYILYLLTAFGIIIELFRRAE